METADKKSDVRVMALRKLQEYKQKKGGKKDDSKSHRVVSLKEELRSACSALAHASEQSGVNSEFHLPEESTFANFAEPLKDKAVPMISTSSVRDNILPCTLFAAEPSTNETNDSIKQETVEYITSERPLEFSSACVIQENFVDSNPPCSFQKDSFQSPESVNFKQPEGQPGSDILDEEQTVKCGNGNDEHRDVHVNCVDTANSTESDENIVRHAHFDNHVKDVTVENSDFLSASSMFSKKDEASPFDFFCAESADYGAVSGSTHNLEDLNIKAGKDNINVQNATDTDDHVKSLAAGVLECPVSKVTEISNLEINNVNCQELEFNENAVVDSHEHKTKEITDIELSESPLLDLPIPFKVDHPDKKSSLMDDKTSQTNNSEPKTPSPSIIEVLELQIQELRRENQRLGNCYSELIGDLEKKTTEINNLQSLHQEEQENIVSQLKIKLQASSEENERLNKTVSKILEKESLWMLDIDEKRRRLEEMEQALVVISQSKMKYASQLDQEKERGAELEREISKYELQINQLKKEKETMSKLHRVHIEKLELQLVARNDQKSSTVVENPSNSNICVPDTNISPKLEPCEIHECSSDLNASSVEDTKEFNEALLPEECTGNQKASQEVLDVQSDSSGEHELRELRKTLKRLEWENERFKAELRTLSVEAKDKKMYEDMFNYVKQENYQFQEKINNLEHQVLHLEGENDTIGDYISLYQSQRLALKEKAKEKDEQIKQLGKEREQLLHKLDELTKLLHDLKALSGKRDGEVYPNGESVNLEGVNVKDLPSVDDVFNNHCRLHDRIENLLTEIGSSKLMEQFHPCAVCSGRLMTV